MNSRDEFLKKFRGDALGKIDRQSSLEEYFQNTTLRPILNLQRFKNKNSSSTNRDEEFLRGTTQFVNQSLVS